MTCEVCDIFNHILTAVFEVDIYTAFVYNFAPLSAFMMVCYFLSQKYQLIAAFVISIVYSLVMMAGSFTFLDFFWKIFH